MLSKASRPGLWRQARQLADYLIPELNFITLHYLYFILTSLITALIFWGSSTPFQSVSFIDALFLTSSAMTEAGLNTINLSTLNTWQQFMLFALIMLGSTIFVSMFVVLVRLRAFNREFNKTIQAKREHRQRLRANSRGSRQSHRRASSRSALPSLAELRRAQSTMQSPEEALEIEPAQDHQSSTVLSEKQTGDSPRFTAFEDTKDMKTRPSSRSIRFSPPMERRGRAVNDAVTTPMHVKTAGDTPTEYASPSRRSFFSFTGVGATAASSLEPRLHTSHSNDVNEHSSAHAVKDNYSRWTMAFGRNSTVYGLSVEERHDLGGREYNAILLLSVLVPLYFTLFQLLGAISCGAWIATHRASTAEDNGINPWWLGAFNAVSAFNNSGMSLLDANMTAFQDSVFLLLSMGLLILAGNTAYPIFLRLALWIMWKLLPDSAYWHYEKETVRFLLDHPRRCYTNLFPSQHTWWLSLTLVTLNGIDWAMFEILNIGNTAITSLSDGIEALDGLFQALAVRAGGFYVVPIASTRISLQVLYVVMMFISAYPVAITMRNSNIYEERSLGIFHDDIQRQESAALAAEPARSTPPSPGYLPFKHFRFLLRARSREDATTFLRQQLRAQLSHDAWWLALAVFLITIIENSSITTDPVVFSVFNILFEVVSGYACCGISVGVPWAAYSFCGEWHTLSKLIMVAVMIRGRHRGLPVAIDSAVQLPGRRVWEAEEEDARLRAERSNDIQRDGQAV